MATPKKRNRQNATLSIRLYSTEKATITKAAKTAGIPIADAVRRVMLRWAKRSAK